LQDKIKERLFGFFLNPLIIAIPFALITIVLWPDVFSKSSFSLVSLRPADKKGKNTIQHYHDLDNDGLDEEISHFRNTINQCAIKITTGNGKLAGQWNLNGFPPPGASGLLYLDFNNDGVKEVFCIYQRVDSVFMAGIDYRIDSTMIIKDLFIDKIDVVNERTDFTSNLLSYDLNQDGINEAIVIISAGHSKQPRKIYTYNFANNVLNSSATQGFKIGTLSAIDINDDKKTELIASTSSSENIIKSSNVPFSDYERWFVIYDNMLRYHYGPVKLGDGAGTVYSCIFEKNNEIRVIVCDKSTKSDQQHTFYEYLQKNNSLQKINPAIDISNTAKIFRYTNTNQDFLAVYNDKNGMIYLLDPFDGLRVKKTFSISSGMNFIQAVEIINKGNLGYAFQKNDLNENYLRFYSPGFRIIYEYSISNNYANVRRIALRNVSPEKKHLVLQLDEDILELEYHTDSFYYLKNALLYLVIYSFYVLIIYIITMTQKRLLHNHYKREQALTELKLVSIRNQMDPHFTFNAINAIAAAIYKEDRETAYTYFSIFSKLIRSTMLYSDRMTRSLDEEIDFTVKYLKIEKFRFRDKFNFKLDIDDNVNLNMEVPRMVIQTYAESAVSNGLMNRVNGGLLHIKIGKQGDNLLAIFDDNGVGIEECKRLNKDKAFKSAKIMDEFIKLFNDYNNANVTCKMENLNLNEEYRGTRVTVTIPIRNYKSIKD
jgi:sensor histidine kinase YesM